MDLIRAQIDSKSTLDRFINIISAIDGVDAETAAASFEMEKYHFLKAVAGGKDLTDCTQLSAMGVFLDVISGGLSFNPEYQHVYLKYRSTKIANGREKRMVYSKQPSGKVFQCQRAGSIAYVTRPVIVYEGELFAVSTNAQGEQIILHTAVIPRTSKTIIAGYVFVVLPNGKREPFWMDTTDLDRLRGYSERDGGNSTANALYTSGPDKQIDTGFFGAKLTIGAIKPFSKTLKRLPTEIEDGHDDRSTPAPLIASPVAAPATILEHPPANSVIPPPPAASAIPGDDEDGPF